MFSDIDQHGIIKKKTHPYHLKSKCLLCANTLIASVQHYHDVGACGGKKTIKND